MRTCHDHERRAPSFCVPCRSEAPVRMCVHRQLQTYALHTRDHVILRDPAGLVVEQPERVAHVFRRKHVEKVGDVEPASLRYVQPIKDFLGNLLRLLLR